MTGLRGRLARLAALAWLAAPAAAGAQDGWGWEQSSPPATAPATPEPQAPQRLRVSGSFLSDFGFWTQERTDDDDLARARQRLDLALHWQGDRFKAVLGGTAEYDFAYLHDRHLTGRPELDVYEWLIEPREAYVATNVGALNVSVGRQIVSWAEADLLSLLDEMTPRDLREPGLQEAGDLRLPVFMTHLDWASGAHRLELLGVHEADFGLRPPPLGRWSPIRKPILDSSLGRAFGVTAQRNVSWVDDPDRVSWDGQQIFGRWSWDVGPADLSFVAGHLLHQPGVLEPVNPLDFLRDDDVHLHLDHERYTTLGHSGVAALGNFVLTWEAAMDLRRPVTVGDVGTLQIETKRRDMLSGVVGVRYEGFANSTVSLEYTRGNLRDALAIRDLRGLPALSLRYTRRFLRDRLSTQLLGVILGDGADQGWLARLEGSYQLRDGLQVTLGYASYHEGPDPGPLLGLGANDQVFVRLRWDFAVR